MTSQVKPEHRTLPHSVRLEPDRSGVVLCRLPARRVQQVHVQELCDGMIPGKAAI